MSPEGNTQQTETFDLITIGMGPAGMAVSAMGAAMGLKVAGIEANKIGGECMNVGCIPSKALLRSAKARAMFDKLASLGLAEVDKPAVVDPFDRIASSLSYISQNKTLSMFDKVDLVLGQGWATFVDPHTVAVGDRRLKAKHIFICAGTRPFVPDIDGLDPTKVLTNENMFHQDGVPESMIVLGSGAIAVEMAQAFARLGSDVTMVFRGPGLIWREDVEAGRLLEQTFEAEGITLVRHAKIQRAEHHDDGRVTLHVDGHQPITAATLLAATGRRMAFDGMGLEQAGVQYSEKGITVDRYLRTTARHIFAPGDCNGYAQLSHAAMHQGMLALINCMLPGPAKRDYRKFVVPWTIFTEPQISWVGPRESELKDRGVKYDAITVRYEDYGAAIAEQVPTGFVKVLASPLGRVYAAGIVGQGSSEAINEWALVIQKKIRLHDVMLLQHSFPSMAFLNKRIAETWMINKMKSTRLQRLCQRLFRW